MVTQILQLLKLDNPGKASGYEGVTKRISLTGIRSKLAILAAVLIFAYFGTFVSLIREWSVRDDYSHGFLIPFISVYFAWAKRERLKRLQIQPGILSGLSILVIGVMMLIAGDTGGVEAVKQTSLLVTLPGLVLLLGGAQFLRALLLPLAYLILMIPPVLDALIGWMHWPFQLFAVKTAAILLSAISIPVFHHAQFLELPNATIDVANACSGVRYLISIIAIGIPLAVFTQKTITRRILLIALSILVGIIANPMRIALIGVWAYKTGEVTHGPLHVFQGLFISIIALIFLFAFAWFLARSSFTSYPGACSFNEGRRPEQTEMSARKNNNKIGDGTDREQMKRFHAAWFASLAVFAAAGLFLSTYRPVQVPLGKNLRDFPAVIGEWRAVKEGGIESVPTLPGADTSFARTYRNSNGRELTLYVGYFAFQRRDKQFVHWDMRELYDDIEELIVPFASDSSTKVNSTTIQTGIDKFKVLYWYYLNGNIITDPYRAKLMTALNSLIGRTSGAIVIISGTIKDDHDATILLGEETKFTRLLLPVLSLYFSGNKNTGGVRVF